MTNAIRRIHFANLSATEFYRQETTVANSLAQESTLLKKEGQAPRGIEYHDVLLACRSQSPLFQQAVNAVKGVYPLENPVASLYRIGL